MDDGKYREIRILLVDDSSFARSVARRVLQGAGITSVVEAGGGHEALDLLNGLEPPIDVIFCDLLMPDLDGVELIRRLALLATSPAIVFLSGADPALLNTVEDMARARGLNILGTIEKPLTPPAIHQVLSRFSDSPAFKEERNAADISERDLTTALAKDQFLLHYQPKVSLADGNVVGFESLARWLHPEKGLIPPNNFIPAAERSGQIGVLTDRITTLALTQCAAWSLAGLQTKISVNLSAHMLVDLDLPDRMARDAASFGINPHRIILEITESGVFADAANTLDILARLHMKGFPLSIDDFGTGYSSMEQLRRIPFAEMKIDRAFVHGAATNPKARAILDSSTSLGRNLGISVVAEGVETQEDWTVVRAAGVDLVQGYFVARPMAARDIQPWLMQSAWKIPTHAA